MPGSHSTRASFHSAVAHGLAAGKAGVASSPSFEGPRRMANPANRLNCQTRTTGRTAISLKKSRVFTQTGSQSENELGAR